MIISKLKYKLLTPTAKAPEIAFGGTEDTMCFDVFSSADVNLLAPPPAINLGNYPDYIANVYSQVVDPQGNSYLAYTGDETHPHPSILPYANIPTGVAFALPKGVHLSWGGRSGLAFKNGRIAFEGKIDSNYRGEIKLMLWSMNPQDDGLFIPAGTKLGQLEVVHYTSVYELEQVDELPDSTRGAAGFGSTGT